MEFDIEAIRARQRARREGTDGPACEEDIDALLEALDDAIRELARLREDNDDLRGSATIWADLYEASVATQGSRFRELLDAITTLREALEELLLECAACVPRHAGNLRDFPVGEFCARCAKAANALLQSSGWSAPR